jgi:hypothetical protein
MRLCFGLVPYGLLMLKSIYLLKRAVTLGKFAALKDSTLVQALRLAVYFR